MENSFKYLPLISIFPVRKLCVGYYQYGSNLLLENLNALFLFNWQN